MATKNEKRAVVISAGFTLGVVVLFISVLSVPHYVWENVGDFFVMIGENITDFFNAYGNMMATIGVSLIVILVVWVFIWMFVADYLDKKNPEFKDE